MFHNEDFLSEQEMLTGGALDKIAFNSSNQGIMVYIFVALANHGISRDVKFIST